MSASRSQLLIIRRTANTLEVPLPAEITGPLDAANALAAATEAIPKPGQLTDLVLTALSEGRDYHADKKIQAALLDHVVHQLNLPATARARADDTLGASIVEHADTILTGWAKALQPHADALAAAAEHLPTHDLGDAQTIAAHGAEVMKIWGAAHEAVKKWQAATEGFGQLTMATRLSRPDPFLVLAAPDTAAFERAWTTVKSQGTRVDAWALAQHGVPLSLPTLSGYMERVAERQARVAEAQKREAARRKEAERPRVAT